MFNIVPHFTQLISELKSWQRHKLKPLKLLLLVLIPLLLILSIKISRSDNNSRFSLQQLTTTAPPTEQLWSSNFSQFEQFSNWGQLERGNWGLDNLEIRPDPTQRFSQVLRVYYPANSASPTVARKGNPLGGGQFYADLYLPPQEALILSYYVRFSENFDFVKGGKLPGLYGGEGNSGGDIPDGTDGFSTRYMWRRNGDGEIYAYLPTSQDYGTSIGRGNWQFQPGKWYYLQQEIILNDPNEANGSIRVWVNGKQEINAKELVFRTTDILQIDGILFSTFFGGGDESWATPEAVYADFAQFSVSPVLSNSNA